MNKYQLVTMKIPVELYKKSDLIIPNRTQDYIDYLERRVATTDRASLIQKELDELDTRQELLRHELELELATKEEKQNVINEYDSEMESALETIKRIAEVEGMIGEDKIEQVALWKDVSLGELKLLIPDTVEVVKFHPQYVKKENKQFMNTL